MKTFAIGDIHANYKGLMQCLERSGFNNETDTLISLGDVVDGHSQSFEVVEELLKIKNLIAIKGNHDDWFNTWIQTNKNPANWGQGQKATGLSYLDKYNPDLAWFKFQDGTYTTETIQPYMVPTEHRLFFENQLPYFLDDKNRLFIHGGFNRHERLEEQQEFIFWWDRDLWSQALSWQSMTKVDLPGHAPGWKPKFKMVEEFEEVFIGHTTTEFWGETEPMHAANIWNLDTGGGWFGRVSIMCIDSKEFWQSDKGQENYPEFKGR